MLFRSRTMTRKSARKVKAAMKRKATTKRESPPLPSAFAQGWHSLPTELQLNVPNNIIPHKALLNIRFLSDPVRQGKESYKLGFPDRPDMYSRSESKKNLKVDPYDTDQTRWLWSLINLPTSPNLPSISILTQHILHRRLFGRVEVLLPELPCPRQSPAPDMASPLLTVADIGSASLLKAGWVSKTCEL